MIRSFRELASKTGEKAGKKSPPIAGIVWPNTDRCYEALARATGDGLVRPLIIGPAGEVQEIAKKFGFDFEAADDLENAIRQAVNAARLKRLDFIYIDAIDAKDIVDNLKKPESGFTCEGRVFSHIGLLQVSRYPKIMFVTDGVVSHSPDVAGMMDIIENAASLVTLLGAERPIVALLAAVEKINPAMPVTVQEADIARMSGREQLKKMVIEGPLSFDVAVNERIARLKGMADSKAAGKADVFVGPSMETANGIYKAMVMYAGAEGAGIIYGGRVPVLTSYMVDTADNIYNSLMLGAYLAAR